MKFTRKVLIRAMQVSLVVGTILVLINHNRILFGETVTPTRLIQIILCFIVPFIVSLYSQIIAIRHKQSDQGQPSMENTSGR